MTEELPLEQVRSAAALVLVGPDRQLISEHPDTPSAVRARLEYLRKNPAAEADIYRRTARGWIKY